MPAGIGSTDLAQYWTAARLFADGANPFDAQLVAQVQSGLPGVPKFPILMWNPPWILPLIWPLALVSFKSAVAACFVFSLILILIAFKIELSFSSAYWASRNSKIIFLLFLLSFHAWRDALFYGQISPLMLLGLCVFMRELRLDFNTRFSCLYAGLGLALTLIKPHALFLIYIYIFFESTRQRSIRQACFICLAIIALLVCCAALWQPQILSFYFKAWQVPPIYWKTPTLGSWLQGWSGIHQLWMRLLPTALAGLLCAALCLFCKIKFSDIYSLLPLSLLLSPYTWGYDHLLLLPSCLYVLNLALHASKTKRWRAIFIMGALVGANLLIAFAPGIDSMEQLVWYPALVFILVQFSKSLG